MSEAVAPSTPVGDAATRDVLADIGLTLPPDSAGEATLPELPLLQLRDGLPSLLTTADALIDACLRLAGGTGPIALDTERAGGYRYSSRAYLIQVRRAGAGTMLIDPLAVGSLEPLADALGTGEWILHAASQDLPCLAEAGLLPRELFDTELAGRLLGWARVGLAPMVAEVLGRHLPKGFGAADWSARPLPENWLRYAALDVEVLPELRDHLRAELEAAGKWEWARQEFAALTAGAGSPPVARREPWRRTSGLHSVHSRRGLAIVRELWLTRDRLAASTDIAPGRLLPDSAIIAAALNPPRDAAMLPNLPGFFGRGAARYRRDWAAALTLAASLREDQLPTASGEGDAPPPARTWARRDPAAAARLEAARAALHELSEQVEVPVENLVSPDIVRRLLWQPSPGTGESEVTRFLLAAGARQWQIEATAPLLARALG
ncbi:MAG: HRDC domain-containing protein [Candidatus Nanopelagicales bacterium]